MQTPVLVYHQIVPDTVMPSYSGCAIQLRQFQRDMTYLASNGYRTVSLEDLLKGNERQEGAEKTVCLTFDDGYEDFYLRALPVLRDHGFTAAVFLVTGLVGGVSDWYKEKGCPLMDWDRIALLAEMGVSFGSHTCTHPRLSRLPPAQAHDELARSKEMLDSRVPQPCTAIAYPYGDSNRVVQHLAEKAGYTLGFGLERGRASQLHLRRWLCRTGDTLAGLAFKLSPLGQTWLEFREDSDLAHALRKVKSALFQD